MGEHAFYEAITHANNRILYGNPVTDFPHVRASFVEAYARLVAMKLFSDRAIDYFRSASLDDRRYLLFNPVTKSKVTSEGETVVTLLWDVIGRQGLREEHLLLRSGAADRRAAAAGRHRARQRRADPEVHAELHVQPGGLIRRSAPATTRPTTCSSGHRARLGAPPRCSSPTGQRFTKSTRTIPNVALFYEQVRALKELLATAAPDADQMRDLDFLLVVGHLFTLVVYGQLILEQAGLTGLDARPGRPDLRLSRYAISPQYAVALHGKPSSTAAQQEWAISAVRKPVVDAERFDRVWQQVKAYDGAYEMRP